jgi:CheY-like chemotaxis protein
MRALILENSLVQQDPLPKVLKDLGYAVMCISGGDDALEAANDFRPDLIVADAAAIRDWEGGISRCKRILNSAPGTSLVFILGSSDDHILEECASLSPLAIFRRPIDIAAFSRIVYGRS